MDSTKASSDIGTASISDMTIHSQHHNNGPTTNGDIEDDEEGRDVEALSNAWTVRDWLTVIGGFAAVTATGGSVTSIGLLQTHWVHHQLRAYSPRDVGWISGANICLTLFLPVLAGPVFDRHGHLWLLLPGSTLFVVGLFLMSFLDEGTAATPAVTFGALLLTWGVLCGAGNGLVSTAVSGVLCRRFNRRRGFACGLSSMGNSVGGIVWPLLLRETLSRWGWGWALRLLAGSSVALLVVGAVLISNSPGHRRPSVATSSASSGEDDLEVEKRLRSTLKDCLFDGVRCFCKVEFVLMTASLAIFQFIVMGIVGTLPSWGKLQGFDMPLLFNVVAVMNT
jgi:MFS family permease